MTENNSLVPYRGVPRPPNVPLYLRFSAVLQELPEENKSLVSSILSNYLVSSFGIAADKADDVLVRAFKQGYAEIYISTAEVVETKALIHNASFEDAFGRSDVCRLSTKSKPILENTHS